MALTVPTWIAAVATAVLAIGAAFTVYYARKAFTAQSQQLKDRQEVNSKQTLVLDRPGQGTAGISHCQEGSVDTAAHRFASTVVAWQDEPV